MLLMKAKTIKTANWSKAGKKSNVNTAEKFSLNLNERQQKQTKTIQNYKNVYFSHILL